VLIDCGETKHRARLRKRRQMFLIWDKQGSGEGGRVHKTTQKTARETTTATHTRMQTTGT